jgi:hypothetical protein
VLVGWLTAIVCACTAPVHVDGACYGLLVQELEDQRGSYAQHYWMDLRVKREMRPGVAIELDARAEGQEEAPAIRLRGLRFTAALPRVGSLAVGAVEARWGRRGYYPNLWLDSPLWDTGLVVDARVWGVRVTGALPDGTFDAGIGASGDGNEAFFARISREGLWTGVAYESKDSQHRARGWAVGGGVELRGLFVVCGYRRWKVAPFNDRRDGLVGLVELRWAETHRCGGIVACMVESGTEQETTVEGIVELRARLHNRWGATGRLKAWGADGADPVWLGIEPLVTWQPAHGTRIELAEELGLPARGPVTYTLRLQTGWVF